jgi:Arc/MetJ-type ribon-helix-helix transcriptional regulator
VENFPIVTVLLRLQTDCRFVALEDLVAAVTVGFAVAEKDRPRLERLVTRLADGNRSEFLRQAIRVMSVQERADRLRSIQARAHAGVGRVLSADEVNDLVKRTLAQTAAGA